MSDFLSKLESSRLLFDRAFTQENLYLMRWNKQVKSLTFIDLLFRTCFEESLGRERAFYIHL